ncbi:MAG: TonB family protein [Flavobacteriales bacterium]|nr:TonB family protein [Flavobacteriales bacterium]MCW8912663.1 TonB family protein [Flavobacteriales bacterium]MCW8938268.1 TonB family protein [Flavobacteriales bacterium]MCW8940172.1 TonB family protein [Flavobacteriales bacterium]MCW8967363.1 TonB family protein [Flavobacteriales bacterium]
MNHFQKTTKKNERMRFVYFQLGLLISFSLTFFAFEWTTYYSVKDLKGVKIIDDDIETVLPPVNPEVEKPIVKTEPTPRKNIDKLIIVDDVNKKTTEEPTKEDPYVEPKFDDKWVEVEPPVIDPDPIDYPDEMPGFIGGDKALYQYLSNNIKYPKIEIKRGVEGRVYVEFVVGKNGEITDIKILRGVSESIDAEAIRVIKAMPNWLPGKQKGRAVKVRYKMPISFKLIK